MESHEKIRTLRGRRGLSQEYMAHTLGMSQNGYQKIESGKVALKVSTLMAVAQALETAAAELLPDAPAAAPLPPPA